MAKNRYKQKHLGVPIEKHDTAAWADIVETKTVSGVHIPSVMQVRNAKEYVDTNEK